MTLITENPICVSWLIIYLTSPLPPLEKLEKLEIFQFAPTIPEFRQLEKTRKKLEVL